MTGVARVAAPRGIRQFGLTDTCCIDKTSSTELSEAINSMFDWYRKAAVCYAYLVDVSDTEADHYRMYSAFRQSRSFTRGWTLQELLAPETVIFYDRDWKVIGTKSSLSRLIAEITRISQSDMVNFEPVNVAVKMSWASRRQTTRTEDIAYCLMGLFGIRMPMLYGEGENAFLRLQLEILKISDDETIFAWDQVYTRPIVQRSGLLAPEPAYFARSENTRQKIFNLDRPEYSMTNKGLRMELFLYKPQEEERIYHERGARGVLLAPLNCTRNSEGRPFLIYLEKVSRLEGGAQNEYTRWFPSHASGLPTELVKEGRLSTSKNLVTVRRAS